MRTAITLLALTRFDQRGTDELALVTRAPSLCSAFGRLLGFVTFGVTKLAIIPFVTFLGRAISKEVLTWHFLLW